MKKTTLLPFSAALLVCANVYAAEENEVYQQAKTVVTASRYEQAQDDIIPSITVIDREDILNLQAISILDILSLQQGIDVARNGGNGTATSVFMRGTNSNHTLVLIDGMRVSSSFTGSFAWEHLPVSQIERIEIVRGTRVSYYGSDAIGGVINIITRKQDKLYVRYTTGSYDTHNFDVGYGGSTDKSQYSLIVGSQKTDGFSATNTDAFAFNPDDDGYENLSVNISAAIDIKGSKLSLNYLESRADIDFDSSFNVGNSDTTERITRIAWQGQIFNNWDTEVAIGNNRNSLVTKVFSNSFSSDRDTFDILLNKGFNNKHLGFGLSYRNEDSTFHNALLTPLNYSDSRDNLAAFANWRGVYNKNTISISGRFDHNDVYGNDSSGGVDWAYQFNEKVRFNLSVGTAFHAPNLNELFSPSFQSLVFSPELGMFVNFFSFEGNPDLKPEESVNYEIGLKTRLTDNQSLSFNLFYYQIDNLVDFQGSTFKPVNVNESTIRGIEADYSYQYNNFNLNINATVQDANNDETDTPLLRRPDNKMNISVDKFFNKFSIGSSIRYASKNPDFGVKLDGYTVIDLRAAYALNNHWKVAVKIENAADENYQVVSGFNTAGASGYLTIEWQQ
ncbi:MAG: TonB-dependent receptor [Alcanivoracaceae bacterium]|nr:TonB-dependent receptor [Alcanivoracaceae bacterium]